MPFFFIIAVGIQGYIMITSYWPLKFFQKQEEFENLAAPGTKCSDVYLLVCVGYEGNCCSAYILRQKCKLTLPEPIAIVCYIYY